MSNIEIIRIQSKDIEMHRLYLSGPDSEGYNDFVYARKNSFNSLDDFLVKATTFLDSEDGFAGTLDSYADYYCGLDHTQVDTPQNSWHLPGLRRWPRGIDYEKESVTVIIEGMVGVVDIGPQKWDDQTSVIETETDYILYIRGTTG